MYNYQNADGSFPEAGPPLLQQGSDTYHMWSMIGTYNYVLYTNDTTFLQDNWAGYLKAMAYIYDKVQPSGLLNVTGTRDWARWQTGFNMSEVGLLDLWTRPVQDMSCSLFLQVQHEGRDLLTKWGRRK
jgi:hypothetical protein